MPFGTRYALHRLIAPLSCALRSRLARLVAITALLLVAAAPGVARASTVVSFTFDDGRATAYNAGGILNAHHMKGTFYINSNLVGSDNYYMTWPQLDDLAALGNEIGGHTLDHTVLTGVSPAEAQRQVCDDRAALQAHGFTVNSFAYPEIAYNASVEQTVRDCGYHSARAGDAAFPPAETLPPADPFAIRTVQAADANQTLQQMKDMVTNVENSGGGWVVFLMHSVCSGCPDQLNTTPSDLDALAAWLEPRAASGTTVRTVGEVIDGLDTTPPTSTISCNGGSCSSTAYTSTPVMVSLSGNDDRTPASGVAIKYTTDGSDPAVNGLPYTAPFPVYSTSTVRWYAQDASGNVETSRSKQILINAQQALPRTTVSLTFDDGTASEYWARDELKSRGMQGTFYINSARVGTSGYYMNWSQIQDLYADGNEIGGHTAHHVNLPAIEPDEAKREICNDRANLLARGYQATNLAYPFGAQNADIQQMAQDCGYNSARTTAPALETIPPANPYAIRVGSGSNDLQALKDAVTAAENNGGGWVPIVFHQICNACDTNWVTQSDFSAFLDWLKTRESNGTAVRTMQQALGGSVKPAVQRARARARGERLERPEERLARVRHGQRQGAGLLGVRRLRRQPADLEPDERRALGLVGRARRRQQLHRRRQQACRRAGPRVLHAERDARSPLHDHRLVQVEQPGVLHRFHARHHGQVRLLEQQPQHRESHGLDEDHLDDPGHPGRRHRPELRPYARLERLRRDGRPRHRRRRAHWRS